MGVEIKMGLDTEVRKDLKGLVGLEVKRVTENHPHLHQDLDLR